MELKKELKFVENVAIKVAEQGGRVYFVGGYVRDKFLGKSNKDIDVEVFGISIEKLKGILNDYGSVIEVGQTFGVLMVRGYDIDFSLPRTERSTGDKHTDFDIVIDENLSVKEASKRRDFTINAISQDVITKKYIDYYNGIDDIKNKVIRYVNKNTFVEDELRAFRACQFASRFSFSIDESVINISKQFNYKSLSKERIYEELNKALLKSKRPSIAFNYLNEIGIIDKLYPELKALIGCTQSKEHHPEGDVWNHTMMVLDECNKLKDKSNNPLGLMYTALCHDLGKPKTREIRNNKITFYRHDKEGVSIAEKFMRKLTNEKNVIQYVKDLTYYHMKGHSILELKDSTLRKLVIEIDINELLLFSEADELGRGIDLDYNEIRKKKYNKVKSVSIGEFGKVVPYFMGKDLIRIGYKPGKEMGEVLNLSYKMQLNGKSKDHIYGVLKSKVSPKKEKVKVDELVDSKTNQLIGNNKMYYNNTIKRLNLFKTIKDNLETKIKISYSKKGIPYIELIQVSNESKFKYLITPLYINKMSLNNEKSQEIFNVYEYTIEERLNKFSEIVQGVSEDYQFLQHYGKVYGRLK